MYVCETVQQLPADGAEIDNLLDLTFGLSRRTKTSYRLREGNNPISCLSMVVREPGLGIAGAISYWPVRIGSNGTQALLLGPLAVHPQRQGLGIGLKLMQKSLEMAKFEGHSLIILVGDQPYYGRVGFAKAPEGKLVFPGYVDPERLLFLNLQPGAINAASGLVLSPHRFVELHGN